MPKTNAEKKRDERKRKREAGLVPLEIWIKPAWREVILKLLDKLKGGDK